MSHVGESGGLGWVVGETYLPSYGVQILSNMLTLIFQIGLVLVFFGESIFSSLNFPDGVQMIRWMKDRQLMVVGALFVCNMLGAQLLASGAFEVYFNDQLVFSKLQEGSLPQNIISRLLHTFQEMQQQK